ncbi:MAG: ATP-binding cassette domain-containing protein [Actinobacteria bacterium]|nr:ATP-binding cassette domain-containing protein [Actinomycetota bacterium]
MTSSPPAVEANGLVEVFGVTPALVGVDLVAPRGTVCGLIGGNGAGKTTLLRCVATALRPTLGHVAVLGVDAGRRPADVRPLVDLVATAGGAYLDMSGVENLRFALAMRGTDASDGDVARALARAGLERAATDRARTYSTGMLRRLALARGAVLMQAGKKREARAQWRRYLELAPRGESAALVRRLLAAGRMPAARP